MAFFNAGLAGGHARPADVLSDKCIDHRARDFVLLGGADGHDGYSFYGQSTVPYRVLALDREKRRRTEDVEVQRYGDRPDRRESRVWAGRHAVHAGLDGCAGFGPYLDGGSNPEFAQFRE